jgi:DNA-binding response OmpR family regulator
MEQAPREILLVERDQPTAELYRRELSREYHVITCVDKHAVLDLLRTHNISAVVLEPALDNGYGWHLLSAIIQLRGARSIPIVVCSTIDARRRGIDGGAAAYLVKPTLPTTLCDTLRRVIAQD